jgi:hypothetical protein
MATIEQCKAKQPKVLTCAGAYVIDVEQQKQAYNKVGVLMDSDIDGLRTFIKDLNDKICLYTTETFIGEYAILTKDDKGGIVVNPAIPLAGLVDVSLRLVRFRKPCNNDQTAELHALPFDGGTYTIKCNKCGTVTTVSRPCADENRSEQKARPAVVDIGDIIK